MDSSSVGPRRMLLSFGFAAVIVGAATAVLVLANRGQKADRSGSAPEPAAPVAADIAVEAPPPVSDWPAQATAPNAIEAPESERADEPPRSEEEIEFEKSVREYRAAVSALDEELTRVRRSSPVIGKFVRLFLDVALPMGKKGEECRQTLAKEAAEDEAFESRLEYDEAAASKPIRETIGCLFGEVTAEIEEFVREGKVSLGDDEARSLQGVLAMIRQDAVGQVPPPAPYPEGTIEHVVYVRRLAQGVQYVAGTLSGSIFKYPRELEARKEEVEEMHRALLDRAPAGIRGLPPKYVDPHVHAIMKLADGDIRTRELFDRLEGIVGSR